MLSGACPGEGRGRSTGAGSASFRRETPACAGEAVRGGPNPSDTRARHTHLLPSQEPDQVPFWLWGQGQDGLCGRCTVLQRPRQVRPG